MSRQLSPGTYGIYQHITDTIAVGAVFTEPGLELNTTIEHYILYTAYVAPSLDANGTSQNPLIVKACKLTDLKAGATSSGVGGATTLSDFMAAMRDLQTASGHLYTYVRAACVQSTGVPNF